MPELSFFFIKKKKEKEVFSEYSPVLAWNHATQPEQIEKWREQVRKFVKDPKTEFRSYLPPDKEEWRTQHVITWLAGCAPGLDSEDLCDLRQQKITGGSLFDHFKQPAPPRQAPFPYNLTAGAYNEIHVALARHNLIPAGIFASLRQLCVVCLCICFYRRSSEQSR